MRPDRWAWWLVGGVLLGLTTAGGGWRPAVAFVAGGLAAVGVVQFVRWVGWVNQQ